MILKILLGIFLGFVLWKTYPWFSPRPEFPPLQTDPDDPLMQEALRKAKESLNQFKQLLKTPTEHAVVKLYFVSSSNQVEHLWAEVLAVTGENELKIRLITPPVTHSGRLERVWHCTFDDIEDWEIRDENGRLYGGFSQRAMFAISRRDGIPMPKKLLALEKNYR